MLSEFDTPLSDSDERLLEQIYISISVVCACKKRTFPKRYGTLVEPLAIEIDDNFPAGLPVTVHDMAASNAITSLELYEGYAVGQGWRLWALIFRCSLCGEYTGKPLAGGV